MDSGVIEGGLNVTLTIRLLMHGKVRLHIIGLWQDINSLLNYINGKVPHIKGGKINVMNKAVELLMG